jgi:hypothetical protein
LAHLVLDDHAVGLDSKPPTQPLIRCSHPPHMHRSAQGASQGLPLMLEARREWLHMGEVVSTRPASSCPRLKAVLEWTSVRGLQVKRC